MTVVKGGPGFPVFGQVPVIVLPWIVPVPDPPPAFVRLKVVPFTCPVRVLSDVPFVVKNSPETAPFADT
jgi:hypothetical protein